MTKQYPNVAAIVPVFNPEPGLYALCHALLADYGYVLVVDDGSMENVEDFQRLPDGVRLVRHEVNRGKGTAIKTGIKWVRENCPDVTAIVFADGDGQHRPEDIRKVAQDTLDSDSVTLGVRDFSASNIPFRSRFGNVLTSFFVRLMYRIRIYDTQTGLRGIPMRLSDAMLETSGDRYEYEMRLFGMLKTQREVLRQVPIETIYIENNRASHFHPIKDSFRVYRGLFGGAFLKFCLSSMAGFVIDNVVFTLSVLALQCHGMPRRVEILISLVIARATSATINYLCNRRLVFRSQCHFSVSFMKYWGLVLLIGLLSYGGTTCLSALLDANGVAITVVKIVVETLLFIMSYQLQKKWVFKTDKGAHD